MLQSNFDKYSQLSGRMLGVQFASFKGVRGDMQMVSLSTRIGQDSSNRRSIKMSTIFLSTIEKSNYIYRLYDNVKIIKVDSIITSKIDKSNSIQNSNIIIVEFVKRSNYFIKMSKNVAPSEMLLLFCFGCLFYVRPSDFYSPFEV